MIGGLSLQRMFISLLMLVTIVPIHECAHAWMAAKLGDASARYQGRLTLNPMSHLDLWGTIAFLLVGFGWGKPVPVYSSNLRHPKRDMMLVALAGPASNVLLALLLTIVWKLLNLLLSSMGLLSPVTVIILWILDMLANTSVYWAVFNLLPVPPLDGSRLLEYVLPAKYYWRIMQYQQYIYIGVIILMFTGILSIPISFISGYILRFIEFITQPLSMLAGIL